MSVPRLVPDRPFPAYAFVPGQAPHPVSDPRGHSHGKPVERPAALDTRHWQLSQDYLFGFDLLNHGYCWEAHEVWEGLWHACGRTGPTADVLKALIHLAAAGVKGREGQLAGVVSHCRRAAALFARTAELIDQDPYLGLGLSGLADLANRMSQEPATVGSLCLLPSTSEPAA